MRRQIHWAPSGKARSLWAALLAFAVAWALGLSAAPQWHALLHKIDNQSQHECAATLISSNSVEHSACEPIPVAPKPAPSVRVYQSQRFPRVLALLGFSLLEHAPPARS